LSICLLLDSTFTVDQTVYTTEKIDTMSDVDEG